MYIKIRSRHDSHDVLRKSMRVNRPVVVRFGSQTVMPEDYYEINTTDACMNSANKRTMKELFQQHNVKTALWTYPQNEAQLNQFIHENDLLNSRVIIKSLRGSRGRGLYLLERGSLAADWFQQRGYGGHIIEKYYDYNREYRLHVSSEGCFYTCRKMLRSDIPEENRWFRNDSNSVWIVEENPQFDKPVNWQTIEEECVKALNAVGLTIGACDVRVQSARNSRGELRRNPDFIICEINSAPSFGEITATKYKEQIEKICADFLVI